MSSLKNNISPGSKNWIPKFFQLLEIPTHISDYTDPSPEIAKIIRERFEERGWTEMGERKAILLSDVESIVAAAI
jgi:alcohol dehydrogenase YqhD (iron-dependent ADH family)